jgi:superfamily I DNA and/or RNA helicase
MDDWRPASLSPRDTRNWVYKSVGTIHTFQGKEAETVFLLLGSNPKKTGTRVWASSKPNILNVAVTRAKNLLVVIGNNDTWRGYQYFDLLNKKLDKNPSSKAIA